MSQSQGSEGNQGSQKSQASADGKSPQKAIDRFWDRFATKHPGQVVNILPKNVCAKTKALNPPEGFVGGVRAVKSYDEAALECKKAVEKIAKECRRVNHKYRDPHFDIEFDLKQNRRDCLDGFQDIDDKDRSKPESVKRVTDVFENPQFFIDDATANDIRQGKSGDCWFLAALTAISNKKHLIDRVCVARDETVGVYGFVFHRDGEFFHTIIDDKLYLTASDWWESSDYGKFILETINRQEAEEKYRLANQTGSKALYFAQCREENETWLPLLEKAYAKAHGDFSAIDGGFAGEAIEDLTGGVTTELFTTDILDKDKFWKEEIMKVNDKFLFSCATGRFDKWQDWEDLEDLGSKPGARGGIARAHAYSIMDAVEVKGLRLLKVRNPWGTDGWRGPWSDGSEQWTAEWMQLLDHKFGDDGMFWISYEDLLRRYNNFERTRLFDKEWTITQQWTTVDVPWSADYNDTQFTVTLTKRSPVVIVLSQLDNRYFKGMEGQYRFQLHFRLDKEGEDDYIVRSHGNYSMTRSVSTDLELDAGTYAVLMRITARRYSGIRNPEQVVRENYKLRQNKLIQVGLSYDLAHAKGETHETGEEKAQRLKEQTKKKAADKKKKRAEFRKEKLKEWEKAKKQKLRERRRAKRQEEKERKKAERQKAIEASKAGGAMTAVTGAADVVKEGEKQASAGATETKVGAATMDPAANPTAPTDNKVGAGNEGEKGTDGAKAPPDTKTTIVQIDKSDQAEKSTDDKRPDPEREKEKLANDTKSLPETKTTTVPIDGSAQEKARSADTSKVAEKTETETAPTDAPLTTTSPLTKSQAFEAALRSLPTVTINGAPTTTAANTPTPSLAPASIAVAIATTNGTPTPNPDDDFYDSDASFVSSIDTLLDLDIDDTSSSDIDPADDDGASTSSSSDDTDKNDETDPKNDPWNAICVVGLRVFCKNGGCRVRVLRPRRGGAGGDGEGLDLDEDDVSRGVWGGEGEKRGEGKEEGKVRGGVGTLKR